MDKTIILIISSGRSGTYQLYDLLSGITNVDVEHERMFENLLKLGVKKHHKILKTKEKNKVINEYLEMIKNSKNSIWIDISNALPWVTDDIVKKIQNNKIKIIHIIRDGRKVVSSFYNKFPEIFYKNRDVKKLKNYFYSKEKEPKLDKKFWRPLPDQYFTYSKKTSIRFQNICWYWKTITMKSKKLIKNKKYESIEFRFEDLVNNEKKLIEFFNFLGLKYKKKYFKKFYKPKNVHIPKNFMLTNNQNLIFEKICKDVMKLYNYKSDKEYFVKY